MFDIKDKENIIIICLIIIIIYIIIDKFYKKSRKEYFTEDEVLNKISSIINGDDITFNNVYIKGNLTAPKITTRMLYADTDKSHGVDGNDYIDFNNKTAFYDLIKYKSIQKI